MRCLRGEVRPGDQPLYISNCDKLKAHTGWSPRLPVERILGDLERFWQQNKGLLGSVGGEYLPEPTRAALVEEVAL